MQGLFHRLVLAVLSRVSDQRGQTLGEYGILIAVIAVAVVVVALTLGQSISSLFSSAGHHV